jgi:PKD repeat protein
MSEQAQTVDQSKAVHVAMASVSPTVTAPLLAQQTLAQVSTCSNLSVNFTADARQGPAPFTTNLIPVVTVVPGGSPARVTSISWYIYRQEAEPPSSPTAIQALDPNVPPSDQPFTFTFSTQGRYNIAIRVEALTDTNDRIICPPLSDPFFLKQAFITVTREEEQPDPANFDANNLVDDGLPILPLNDWVPLFSFTMSYAEQQFAPRTLTQLDFSVIPDPSPGPNDSFTPTESDFLEFGIFYDSGPDGEPDGVLDFRYDGYVQWNLVGGPRQIVLGEPMVRWDARGYPYDMPNAFGNFETGDLRYNLNFTFDVHDNSTTDGTPAFNPLQPFSPNNPKRPFFEVDEGGFLRQKWIISGRDPLYGYIVAFRTSAAWRPGTTVAYILRNARMQLWDNNIPNVSPYVPAFVGEFPVNAQGAPIDSYNPNFLEGNVLAEDTSYAAEFHVFDITGELVGGPSPGNEKNLWNQPHKTYTPTTPFARPRWDISQTALQAVSGEWLEIRRLFPVEQWVPVLGIDAHGRCTTPFNELNQPIEVNLVFTDIGADPYGPPGNGGFDPRTMLDPITTRSGPGGIDTAVFLDYAFNGVGLFHDTGGGDSCTGNCPGDGIFQPPTPQGSLGVRFTDYPMIPDFRYDGTTGYGPAAFQWEYIPFPPGGGDPWWKIKLRFLGGRRRGATDGCLGSLEAQPDFFQAGENPTDDPQAGGPKPDYFIVVRADSGYSDISGMVGDGTGLAVGADFRVFVEPRRWNPRGFVGLTDQLGHWDGGIVFTDQITNATTPWNDDPRHNIVCNTGNDSTGQCNTTALTTLPWWHEAFHDRDNVKPLRSGIEVHDLVLTYSTDNLYGKRTNITEGDIFVQRDSTGNVQFVYPTQTVYPPSVFIPELGFSLLIGRTNFSFWTDPPYLDSLTFLPDSLGILNYRFAGAAPEFPSDPNWLYGITLPSPGVTPDLSAALVGRDILTSAQYAFETVPFRADDNVLTPGLRDPRSPFYPNPPDQPTLPSYDTWEPADAPIAFGLQSYCYLASEGAMANEPFHRPTSPNSERTYEDDVYVFVVEDPNVDLSGIDLSGKWLVDADGGRFRILSNDGNRLTLERGHQAYTGSTYRFPGRCDRIDANGNVYIPDAPYGIGVGEDCAIQRGAWAIVNQAKPRNQYANITDWSPGLIPPGRRAARVLRQYVENKSQPVAMLGINVVGVDDPVVVVGNQLRVDSIAVAFWGPEFDPTDLERLDPNGELFTSGVLLYEDTNRNGVYDAPIISDLTPDPVFTGRDRIVPLVPRSLAWSLEPEPIDLDGDYQPDDLSGDGVVCSGCTAASLTPEQLSRWDGLDDRAWVLFFKPNQAWTVPQADDRTGGDVTSGAKSMAASQTVIEDVPEFWRKKPFLFDIHDLRDVAAPTGAKSLPAGGNDGDDLFVVVRTSDTISAFEEFRCVIPARLPSRALDAEKLAGIRMLPRNYPVVSSFTKVNPDESGIQDWFGHDMLRANIAARITDLTSSLIINQPGVPQVPLITPGSPPVAVLGIDTSVNRPANLIAQGSGNPAAIVSGNTFEPNAADIQAVGGSTYYTSGGWTNAVVGLWLIGLEKETAGGGRPDGYAVTGYEITAVNGNTLTLRAGAPRGDMPWKIVKDPSFLEQVIVEFYDINRDGKFDILNDFLPFNYEDPKNGFVSGVSLYRDNDLDPRNTNGVFDPPILDSNGNVVDYIDLPVNLDYPPVLIGTTGGEPETQVKFVFSTPGTDNTTGRGVTPYETQPRRRQWVPLKFGLTPSEEEFGPDFFVVVRTSRKMEQGDDFSAAIVSWGPNTPSEPDPDTFQPSIRPGLPPGQREDEFDIFAEFPWGQRSLGFVSFFQRPTVPRIGAAPGYAYRAWTLDKVTRKVIPFTELDTSQDASTIPLWIRTHPTVAARTKPVTALPAPTVDFTADRNRVAVGQNVNFRLLYSGAIQTVLWRFGDGNTSGDVNPSHAYALPGKYTVSVTVRDTFGIEDTATKVDFIEVLEPPFADFIADPTEGFITPDLTGGREPGLDVKFFDRSVGSEDWVAVSYFWNFGDGNTTTTTTQATDTNPLIHRYTRAGTYDVSLEVTFRNVNTNQTRTSVCRRDDYIVVKPCVGCPGTGEGEGEGGGEGEPTTPPAADFKVDTLIRDKEALVPLMDWVPLFVFDMSYNPDEPAPRFLRTLRYVIRQDKRDGADLGYGNVAGPELSDILEFGLFEQGITGDENDSVLDAAHDRLLFTWSNNGSPVGTVTSVVPGVSITYDLNFIGTGTASNPQFRIENGATSDTNDRGRSYIVAVRTSATWRSLTTLGCDVTNAEMIVPGTGTFPVDENGDPVDSYSPNFFDGEILEPENSYSASFDVWSTVGSVRGKPNPSFHNAWNHPNFMHVPVAELTRPRWNRFNQIFDMVAGEMLELRTLLGYEDWVPVLGINLHSTKAEHFDSGGTPRVSISSKKAAELREVNVVFTDIGADPYGAPGNGGFDPRQALDSLTDNVWGNLVDATQAFGPDVTYNGVWVWYDANNNHQFDPPTPLENGGIQFNGDLPLLPEGSFKHGEWEYIPFPPGGGDPWWKTTLRFSGGARRNLDQILDTNDIVGHVEAVPDSAIAGLEADSEYAYDFFVVVRTDSGFKDVSLLAGDGTPAPLGADFRVFIEPRRFNPSTGHSDGGVYVDSMIPGMGFRDSTNTVFSAWQDDVRWGANEPWWPQRTHNAAAALPLRVGLDVHDLAITYESRSQYRVTTDLFFTDGPFSDRQCFGYSLAPGAPTDFELWTDPTLTRLRQFSNGHSVGVTHYRLFGTVPISIDTGLGTFTTSFTFDETRSKGQFPYETVPFRQDEARLDPRTAVFPAPPLQPDLPRFATWSATPRPYEYPNEAQWAPENIRARILRQKIDILSQHTPILGINLVGANDPIVNGQTPLQLSTLYVAFWGPDFTPDDLAQLDPSGRDLASGVLLWEDTESAGGGLAEGTFFSARSFEGYVDGPITVEGFDLPIELRELRWSDSKEPIDVDGDGVPDDMNGDGLVDSSDYAWVLQITPRVNWPLPYSDALTVEPIDVAVDCGGTHTGAKEAPPSPPSPSEGTVQFEKARYDVAEDEGSVKIRVTRRNGSSGPATVQYNTIDDTAIAPFDYLPVDGLLTWEDGEDGFKEFEVPIIDDEAPEDDEKFKVKLSNPTGAKLGTPSEAAVIITGPNDQSSAKVGTAEFTSETYAVPENGIQVTHEGTLSTALIRGEPTTPGAKALDVTKPQPGDDLFITVRTTEKLSRFEQFRAVIPASLPARSSQLRRAGIQVLPQLNSSSTAFVKSNPEEDPVQDFYGNDTLEANIPAKVTDITTSGAVVSIGGAPAAVLGIDVSTNRGRDTGRRAGGNNGVGGERSFTVPGQNWTPNAFAGDWLIDSRFEAYEILGNTATSLTLRSGRPRDGAWRIVTEPSFLEQVMVEFYNEGTDSDFNLGTDLLPLDIDPEVSGVALYRDNDNDPRNRNGVFDPGVDLPVLLDAPPALVSVPGEEPKVLFLFAAPGTDNIAPGGRAVSLDQQPRHRQWVWDTFGSTVSDPESGDDFFVVVRASQGMSPNDNFRVGLVSWGPNTPTAPDPDTFACTDSYRFRDCNTLNQGKLFDEFPFADRGLGFITFFKQPPVRYYMLNGKAGAKVDNSGFTWVRSSAAVKRRTQVITARARSLSVTSVVLNEATPNILPAVTPNPVRVQITGSGFGTSPVVAVSGYTVRVLSASDTAFTLELETLPNIVPEEPIVVVVTNPLTRESASRNDLLRLSALPQITPIIDAVSPPQGTRDDFPVIVLGRNFAAGAQVTFGSTRMPVLSVSSDGKRITVGFPAGGIAKAGKMEVRVTNPDGATGAKADAFEYINKPPKRGRFLSCAAVKEQRTSGSLGDLLLIGAALGAVFGGARLRAYRQRRAKEENV